MSIEDVITRTGARPATVDSLTADLAALGVEPGMVLLAHTSLSSLGWVCGGALALIQALEQALGSPGTLVIPTHSSDLSDPAAWENPPVPPTWWDTIREATPPYDPRLTPTYRMGVLPELFRSYAGVSRSDHPQVSFAALGPQAAAITENHALHFALGEQSPLARVYDLDGWVLLLGVGHAANTSLHLAEYRAFHPGCPVIETGAPMRVDGARQWVTIHDIDIDHSDFEALGAAYEQDGGHVRRGQVALASAKLIPQRDLVDYAARWLTRNRRKEPDP